MRPHARPCVRHLLSLFFVSVLGASAAEAEDWTLTVETYHDMSLLGPHVHQKGLMKVSVHPPDAVRIEKRGEKAWVLYRYEREGLVRCEIDSEQKTYRRLPLDKAIERRGEAQRASGIGDNTEPPALGLALALENGWKEIRRSDGSSFLQYRLSGELVAAAAVEKDVPQPPAELVYAVFCESPVIHNYWVREALCDLLKQGRVFFFEFFPRGPNYYCLWITEYRKEAGSLPEESFKVPEGCVEKVPEGTGEGDPQADEKSSASSAASSSRWEAKASGGDASGAKNPASSASEPGRGSPDASSTKPITTTEP